jgi:ATP-binding cassette subfamily B protein
VALLVAALLGSIALDLINPQLIRAFLDGITGDAPQSRLLTIAAWFMGLALFQQICTVSAAYFAEQVGWTATNQMREDLTRHVLDLDMGFHKRHTPGELIERVDGDVTSLGNFFSSFTIKVLGNAVLILGVLVLLWTENVWVGFGMTSFVAIALWGMIRIQASSVPIWKQVRARAGELYGFLGEQLEGTEDIRANGGVPYMVRRFTGIMRAWLPERVRGFVRFGALWSTSIGAYVIGTSMVFWLGSIFFGNGTITIGSVYLIFYYTEMIRHPMEEIRSQMEDFQKAAAGISRVESMFGIESAIDKEGAVHLPDGPLSVDFKAVRFAYDSAEDPDDHTDIVIDDVTFGIAPGRVLGVLGRSGSGKTTMARLLTRLYDPQDGEVLIGGVRTADAVITELRGRVGMVTQDVQLFQASIRDNLTFFDQEIDDDRLMEVLDHLGLRDWVEALPDGLDTSLQAGGGGLSAGQAQLLAFTRIFLRDPGLVVLDEASSRLDPATEALIERAVDRLLAGRTAVIIAHRLGTVTRADDILILEDGQVVEFGRRVELASDPESRLAQLLRTGMEEVLA